MRLQRKHSPPPSSPGALGIPTGQRAQSQWASLLPGETRSISVARAAACSFGVCCLNSIACRKVSDCNTVCKHGPTRSFRERLGRVAPLTQPHGFQRLSCQGKILQRVCGSSQQPGAQGRARTHICLNPCCPARLTLKPAATVTQERESCQAVISQSKRK